MKNFATSKSKLGYAYLLTRIGEAKKAIITQRFLRRKLNEYEKLQVEIEALQLEAKQTTSFLANENGSTK